VLVRDENAFQVWARAVKNPNVADAVHKRASGPFRERRERGVARVAIAPEPFHFDELVIVKRAGGLLRDGIRKTLFAEEDYGL
jgi:hypothetical protein